eukprot:g2515.t1 g2515   contig12:271779-273041(+)
MKMIIYLLISAVPATPFHHQPAFTHHHLFTRTHNNNDVSLTAAKDDLFDAEEAAALDAHDVSDSGMEGAAMERAVMMAQEYKELLKKEREEPKKESTVGKVKSMFKGGNADDNDDLFDAEEAAAMDAHDLSDAGMEAASMERALMMAEEYKQTHHTKSQDESARIRSVEEHYASLEKDISIIERLINDADAVGRAENHSLERTFSDDDAANLALLMLEKSVLAATEKLELCNNEATQTELEVRDAIEEKYAAKALAESIERGRHAAEMHFLSKEEYFNDEPDVVMERLRDILLVQTDEDLLRDALKRERDAEVKLEHAIEHDKHTRRELEKMIKNKAALKHELHDLEEIVHEHAVFVWERERKRRENYQ